MVFMNDLEYPMLSYYVIYYEKFKKVKEALMFVGSCWPIVRTKAHSSHVEIYSRSLNNNSSCEIVCGLKMKRLHVD